jgi:hypothetical protein
MPRFACLLLLIAIAAPAAHAEGQVVHRCIGEHGEISFSGSPCAGAATADVSASAISSSATQSSVAGDKTVASKTCPASEDALRDLVADAFTRRDANALAGVMRWEGVGGAVALQRMRELTELTERPLLGIDIDRGAGDVTAADSPSGAAAMITVHTSSLSGGAGEYAFRLMPAGGCYWLEF